MKRVYLILVLMVVVSAALADDKPKAQGQDAREGIEAWVAAVLAGKVDEANALTDPGEKDFDKVAKEFKDWLGVGSLKIPTVYVSEKQGRAVAVSEAVKFTKRPPGADDPNPEVLFFKLVKVKDKWLLKKIEFYAEAGAKKHVERFRTSHPDAKELPPKSKE
jgi:hypothetical protein